MSILVVSFKLWREWRFRSVDTQPWRILTILVVSLEARGPLLIRAEVSACFRVIEYASLRGYRGTARIARFAHFALLNGNGAVEDNENAHTDEYEYGCLCHEEFGHFLVETHVISDPSIEDDEGEEKEEEGTCHRDVAMVIRLDSLDGTAYHHGEREQTREGDQVEQGFLVVRKQTRTVTRTVATGN